MISDPNFEYKWGKDPIVKMSDLKHLKAILDIIGNIAYEYRLKDESLSERLINKAITGRNILKEYLKLDKEKI